MAKTLLDGVNEVMKRVKLIAGAQGELTTLTDSARQPSIDTIVQIWNEAVEELYSLIDQPVPNEAVLGSLTLVAGQREYDCPADLVQTHWPLLDTTNGQEIWHYSGGYEQMRQDQVQPASYTGLPHYAVIEPVAGKLRLDRAPTAEYAGRVYEWLYDKDLSLSAAADTFPFEDAVFRAMVPAVANLWARGDRKDFDQALYAQNLARAGRLVTKKQMRSRW